MAAAPAAEPRPAATAPATAETLPRRLLRLAPLLATVALLAAPLPATAGPGTGNPVPADLASGVLVLYCAVRALRDRGRPLTLLAAAVLAAPAAAIALATVTAGDPVAALPGLVRYLQVFVLVPGAVLLLLRDATDFRLTAGALTLLALAQGAIGVHQYATGTGASYMGADVRAVGTFGPGDVMGMATVVAYGLLAAAALALRTPAGAPHWLRPAAIGCCLCLTVPLALSFSRGAWIATAAAGLVTLLLAGVRRAVKVLAAVTALAVVLVGGLGVGSAMISQRLDSITRVTAAPDRSVTDRYTMWAAAAGMWRQEPVTGVGLKGFPDHRDAHATIGLSSGSDTAGAGQEFHKQPLLSPHNMYLLILSEQGLVGLTAFAGAWAALLAAGVRALRRRRGALDCGLTATGLLLWLTVDFLYADIGGPSTVLTGIVLGLAARWAALPLPAAAPPARAATVPAAPAAPAVPAALPGAAG
jgi:O-antigen ligase